MSSSKLFVNPNSFVCLPLPSYVFLKNLSELQFIRMSSKSFVCLPLPSYVFLKNLSSNSLVCLRQIFFWASGGPLETNFCHLRAFGPASKIPFWDHWETALLDQILARSLLEAFFCHLKAFGPAIKIHFWDHWETALLDPFGPNPGQEPFGSNFLQFEGLWAGNSNLFLGPLGNGPFGPNPGQEPFGSNFLPFEGLWAGN